MTGGPSPSFIPRSARHFTADSTPMQPVAERNDPSWVLQVAHKCAVDECLPAADVTADARAQAEATRALSPDLVRQELERILVKHGVHVTLQWLHDYGLLAV